MPVRIIIKTRNMTFFNVSDFTFQINAFLVFNFYGCFLYLKKERHSKGCMSDKDLS